MNSITHTAYLYPFHSATSFFPVATVPRALATMLSPFVPQETSWTLANCKEIRKNKKVDSAQNGQIRNNNRTYRHINGNQCKSYHSKRIPPFTPLWSIPKRKNETHQE
jgi:hypothetical protein